MEKGRVCMMWGVSKKSVDHCVYGPVMVARIVRELI